MVAVLVGDRRQRLNFVQNCLQPRFKLFLGPWFSFRPGKLHIICDRPPIVLSGFIEHFHLHVALC
jgi:hypothetical protein